MFNLLKDIHDKSEQMSGRKVLISFVLVFVVFLSVGLLIGTIISKAGLKESEILENTLDYPSKEARVEYEGKVDYVNPAFYPKENISYALVDASGKQIILLKSKDQKLGIVEGLYVKVTGVMSTTSNGEKEVLNVQEVTIKNATD